MKLNIYQISHPAVRIMVTYIEESRMNKVIHKHYYKYLGLLLIYEMLRRYIKTTQIYIKLLDEIKNLSMTNTKEKYVLFTNISYTYNMLTDIEIIFPHLTIININYKNPETIYSSTKNLKIDLNNANVFILEKFTESIEVLNLLKYLRSREDVLSERINIACITSNNEILEKIGREYPQLKMYTVKITS